MVHTGPNEHSVWTMESKPVRTHSNSLGAHPVVRTQWKCLVRTGSRRLKQSFGCGGRNLCCHCGVGRYRGDFLLPGWGSVNLYHRSPAKTQLPIPRSKRWGFNNRGVTLTRIQWLAPPSFIYTVVIWSHASKSEWDTFYKPVPRTNPACTGKPPLDR